MQTNDPTLWFTLFPCPSHDAHKYARGHCVVIGGTTLTGAARLVATAAARAGAGLVTLVVPTAISNTYRAALPAHIMVEDETDDRCAQLQDPRRNVLVLGPGYGRDGAGVIRWLMARGPQAAVVDADGLNALADKADGLKLMRAGDVMTPHAGEYKRLFGDMDPQAAAKVAGCVIILKGARTIITDGTRVIVNDHASPYLASAGTGDVLAGVIGGLLAQGMPAFEAACAGVWLHGDAGLAIGPGLVASDLPDALPAIIARLISENA